MNPEQKDPSAEPSWLALLKDQVESLRFGVVQIVVHDSQVVQIEKTEKLRLDKPVPGQVPGSRSHHRE